MAALNEDEEFEFRLRAEQEAQSPQDTSMMQDIGQGIGNLAAGAIRGAGSIGATIISPFDYAGLTGMTSEERRSQITEGLQSMGAEPESMLFKGGKLAGEIAGTAGAGGVLAKGIGLASQSPKALALAEALRTGGMTAGGAGIGTRMAGGAVSGGAMAGMINPEDIGMGAGIGAALPPVLKAAGIVGSKIGQTIAGQQLAPEARQAVQSARELGYVIPPTQVKPSLVNRALEGFAGKITTAQNASAKNQQITNELARKSIGASELSPAGIAEVRQVANQAYDAIGSIGQFTTDPKFLSALDNAGASTAEMRKNFPQLVNNEVDTLITSLKQNTQFDSQPTIEAIKQFRADSAANRASLDPAKKALGKAQNKISSALEDLIERNLPKDSDLLTNYRNARQTLAKTYDVEKALNPTTGNIDASRLSSQLKKGRPLTSELRQIAEFSARFPKATQTVEKMGSLPQLSPLDFATGGITGAAIGPIGLAGLVARPAARSLTLSPAIQNRLAQESTQGRLSSLLARPETEQLIYRTAPVIGSR